MENRDLWAILDLEGRGSLVLTFFRGGPGEAAAAGVVSSSQ